MTIKSFNPFKNFYFLTGFFLLIALVLTLLSWLQGCKDACAEGHKYHIFGFSFDAVGFVYFLLLLGTFSMTFLGPIWKWATGLLFAGGLGAEAMFIIVQKYLIGSWCPLCLAIAASVGMGALFFLLHLLSLTEGTKRHSIKTLLAPLLCFALGFLVALTGITKQNDLSATENQLEKKLVFGNLNSDVEVYIVTSWICPACKRFEPALERMVPNILEKSRVIFVDQGNDVTSLNFLPFNLSFMMNSPSSYIPLRHMLKDIANDTDNPTAEQIQKEAAKIGCKYTTLPYADVAIGIDYFKTLCDQFNITALPVVVVMNTKTKEEKKLVGINITKANVLEAIDTLAK